MKKWKQHVMFLLAGVIAFAVMPVSQSYAAEMGSSRVEGELGQLNETAVQEGMLAWYDFADKPSDGKTVANKAGNGTVGAAVVQNESKAEWEDGALVMSGEGTSNTPVGAWVSLPDNLFAGKESATITMEVCPSAEIVKKNHFMWSIGNDKTSLYWFANTYAPRTSIKYAGGEKTASSSVKLTGNRWYSYTGVIDAEKKTLSLYIDGVKVGEATDSGMSLAKVTDQSRNTIGRAPFNDSLFAGSVASFRAYGRALSAGEILQMAVEDGKRHEASVNEAAREEVSKILEGVEKVEIADSSVILPDYGGRVTWRSNMPQILIREDGRTVSCKQPTPGSQAVTGTLTAVASVRGIAMEKEVDVTIRPAAADNDPYGYLMVHFVEDSKGYAEKIYMDISRGDDPQQWEPLNGRNPILASNLGKTGVRDPFLTYNPETNTYYILGTDLRVFGGDNAGWDVWRRNYSTMMNVWESKDLITWNQLRQFDVSLGKDGRKKANLGMMWAPEATWVEDYYGKGQGAFVVYWSSRNYEDEAQTQGGKVSKIMWGATTDFTQDTWEFGGVFLDGGSAGWIDTTIAQNGDKTYHITKSSKEEIIMEVTTDKEWWKETAGWTRIQSNIGKSRFGSVEGPAVFKDHSNEGRWYLFVDDLPTPGYRPMVSENLDKGWEYLDSPDYYLTPYTKHGGVISLTKKQYDSIRNADAVSVAEVFEDTVQLTIGMEEEDIRKALPATVKVNTAYNRGMADLPVDWDISGVNTDAEAEYMVRGTVRSIGANLNQWMGRDKITGEDSESYLAADKTLYSSTALKVEVPVKVSAKKQVDTELVKPEPVKPEPVKPESVKPEPGIKVKKVSINEGKLTLGVKESFRLKATAAPKDATDRKVTWGSSKKSVAEVKNGVVKAKKPGKAIVTAKAGGKSAKCIVTVKKAPNKIAVNNAKKTLKKGKTYQIKVKLPQNTASNKITYKSSKKGIVSISSAGRVKAKKKGRTTVTVSTFNKKKAKIIITVK